MTILVTTPNGKVGSEVAQQLIAAGYDVRIGAHTVEKAQRAFPTTEVIHFDFADQSSIETALAGVSSLYLAAPGDMPAEPVNRVVDLAKAAGVTRIVKLSASGVEQGDSPLRQNEQHIEQSGLDYTFLRPTWFMQNYSTSNRDSIAGQGAFYEPADDGKTAFIDARDIAAVAVAALTQDGHAGKAYTLTGGEALDRHEVAAALSEATGKPVQYVALTDAQFRDAVGAFMSPAYVEMLSALYSYVRQGWSSQVSEHVRQVLGRDPISFQQFAHDHAEVWR